MNDAGFEKLEEKIYELRGKLREINLKIRNAQEEASSYEEKRDEIHAMMRPFVEKLRKIRKEDADKWEKLNKLRETLAEKKSELKARKEKYLEVKRKLWKLKGIKETVEEIQKRIEELDWRLQTQPLPKEEERRIGEVLEILHVKLAQARQKMELQRELEGLEAELEAQRKEMDQIREEIGEVKGFLSERSEQVKQLREKIQALKQKADEWHAKYLEAKERLMKLEAEKILLVSQLIEQQNILKKLKEDEERKRLEERKKRLKAEAKLKLHSGKKLSFEEFKALMEDEEWPKLLTGEKTG